MDSMLIKTKWFQLWKDWSFYFKLDMGGYFDPRPEIHISLLGLHFCFELPFKTKYDECDPPSYGIVIFEGMLSIHYGRKFWAWSLPFVTWVHMGHYVDIKDVGYVNTLTYGKWCEYREDHRNEVNMFTSPYVDSFDNSVVNATFWKEYRVWRRKWLTWLPFFEMKREYIEIEFDKDVGRRKHSWKGGVLGTSYDLLPGEDPKTCLKRMEKEMQY